MIQIDAGEGTSVPNIAKALLYTGEVGAIIFLVLAWGLPLGLTILAVATVLHSLVRRRPTGGVVVGQYVVSYFVIPVIGFFAANKVGGMLPGFLLMEVYFLGAIAASPDIDLDRPPKGKVGRQKKGGGK